MDTILNLMYRHGYINEDELNTAKKVQISDLIINSVEDNTTYPYQAYLDIVYKEVNEVTNLSPYTTPLIIETYLDINIQKEIDKIQQGKIKEAELKISLTQENIKGIEANIEEQKKILHKTIYL